MIIYAQTENSVYVLDTDLKTWERVRTVPVTEPQECECVVHSEGDRHIDEHCPKCHGSGAVHVDVTPLFPLRTTKGRYRERTEPLLVGRPLILICDPLPDSPPAVTFRVVQTSPVIGVSYEAR